MSIAEDIKQADKEILSIPNLIKIRDIDKEKIGLDYDCNEANPFQPQNKIPLWFTVTRIYYLDDIKWLNIFLLKSPFIWANRYRLFVCWFATLGYSFEFNGLNIEQLIQEIRKELNRHNLINGNYKHDLRLFI